MELYSQVAADHFHVAIIMDGSGRWASARALPRCEGHKAGAETIRRVVMAAPRLGIGALSLYAFSSNNWERPAGEVRELMHLFENFFRSEAGEWRETGVEVRAIGRRDRLPPPLIASIEQAERVTLGGGRLRLRIAIDYSARAAIMEAAQRSGGKTLVERQDFSRLLASAYHAGSDDPEVDLLIRTGGERRLSDFLLWEIAYAELYFTDCLWPDFEIRDLGAAVADFNSRQRRYGRIDSPAECLA